MFTLDLHRRSAEPKSPPRPQPQPQPQPQPPPQLRRVSRRPGRRSVFHGRPSQQHLPRSAATAASGTSSVTVSSRVACRLIGVGPEGGRGAAPDPGRRRCLLHLRQRAEPFGNPIGLRQGGWGMAGTTVASPAFSCRAKHGVFSARFLHLLRSISPVHWFWAELRINLFTIQP